MFLNFVLGCIFAAIQVVFYNKLKTKSLTPGKFWGSFICLFIGKALIALAIAWGYASYLESEFQAIAMGFLVFGGIGAILDIVSIRLVLAKGKTA